MASIKPAEVSAILREQLSGFKSEAELEEVGTVLQVGDGIARVYGLSSVQYGEMVEFKTGLRAIALNLEEDNVGVVLWVNLIPLKKEDTVKRLGLIASLKVGEGIVGRVVDTM
ncbi:MAG: F0F1 ATP synthase subunit alpha, partial [Crocinitomicaceae bacterium]|nr:F0F1 ATP synthase subunit alpha [Crocinitomicaceae bacterium]